MPTIKKIVKKQAKARKKVLARIKKIGKKGGGCPTWSINSRELQNYRG